MTCIILVESTILLRGHPTLDLGTVQVTFVLSSHGIDGISWRHSLVNILRRRRAVPLEERDGVIVLPAFNRKLRFAVHLGRNHFAEVMSMASPVICVCTYKKIKRKKTGK